MDKYPFSIIVKCTTVLKKKQEKELGLYFSVKRRSSGGECIVTKLDPTQYRVSYMEKEVMERVLNYAHHKKEFCGERIDFTLEAEEHQEKTNLASSSREEQSNVLPDEDALAPATKPKESSENLPMEQTTFIPLDSNFQYEVIKKRISNEICTTFPSLKILCDNKELKLTGHGDLRQARLLIKNMIASVRERKADVSLVIAGFLHSRDSAEISKKIFDNSDEDLVVFLDISRGFRLYAPSDALLDQAETTLLQCLKAGNIHITSEERKAISQEAWQHLLDTLHTYEDIRFSLQEDSDSRAVTLSLVGLTEAVEEASKTCKHYLSQKILIKEEVDLEHRVVAVNIENLLRSFNGCQLSVPIKVSKPPGQTVTLIGPREEVNKSKRALQEFIQKIHVNNLCINKHGAAHFFKNHGQQILDKLQNIFNCRIIICDSENVDDSPEGASNDPNTPRCTGDANQSEEVRMTRSTSHTEGTWQAERCGTSKKQKKPKPPAVQLVLSRGKLENKQADVLVAPLVWNNPVLEALNVTKNLKEKGGDRFRNLFTGALNQRTTLEPGRIFPLPVPGDNYSLNCNLVIFIPCIPWEGPNGSSSVTALKKGVKEMLENCKKKCSLTISAIGTGKKLKFPEEKAARLIGEEIKLFVESAQNLSLQKIELVIPWENQALFIIYRETLLHMDLGDRLILCNEDGGSFNKISVGHSYKVKVGNMSIAVIHNDITKEKTDAIVNSTNFSHWSKESVAHAIFSAAGQNIVQEAKDGASRNELVVTGQGTLPRTILLGAAQNIVQEARDGASRNEIVVTGNGALPCKWILHCNCKNKLENIPKIVTDILQCCEDVGLRSVAIPAIGTGECGFNPVEVAGHFVTAISLFARTRNTACLTCVHLVTCHPHIYHIFCAQLRKHFRCGSGDSWKPMDVLTSRLQQLWFPSNDIADITIFQHPIPVPPAALLVIVTEQMDNVNEIKLSLKEEFDKQYKEENIEQALMQTFSMDEIHDVFSVVNEKPEVNMILDTVKSCIFLNGCTMDVLEVALKVQTKLTNILSARLKKVTTEQAEVLVQWGYSDDEDSYPFSLEASQLLENRYQVARTGVVTVTIENGRQATVNLQTMMATLGGDKEVIVIRRDLTNETNLPEHWADMNGLFLRPVQLDQNSEEYKHVKANFSSTVQRPIVKIERIQNKYQHTAYTLRKEYMIQKNGPDGVNERHLFHGTEPQNYQSINYTGFNRSFAGHHAAAFGNGVYFAVDASYSAKPLYSPPDPNTEERFMYLAKVLVGHYTAGQRGMRTPPCRQANNPFDVYDSLTDDQNNPAMFVVFHDDQAYPEYLITFK